MTSLTRPNIDRLPIKLIEPNQGSQKAVKAGGSPPVPFRDVSPEFRASLGKQLSAIAELLPQQAMRTGAAPARVKLIPRALAKSHRPENLFSDTTCPIIGAGGLGELFVKATPGGLAQLQEKVATGDSQQIRKEISTVQSIEPVTPAMRRKRKTPREILQLSPRTKASGFLTRVRLFDFGNPADQARLVADFLESCGKLDLQTSTAGYSKDSGVYSVECRTENDVVELSKIVGVRSIIGMPLIQAIQAQSRNLAAQPANLSLATDVEGDYPCVVVVDSGVDVRIPGLAGWVSGQTSTVAPSTRNPYHGSFVAGLIVWGDQLNPLMADIDMQPCGVYDLQVLPNTDPDYGPDESLTESEFLQTLETALKQHANRFKVWNISLGTNEKCAEDEFSAFAEQLDNLQEKYQVSFVIAAGNYQQLPLLSYPRVGGELAAGRITAPADSVLGITVGAVSHMNYESRGPKLGEPSPFSRHGGGPNHIIKPDLVHSGGTCTIDGQIIDGIRSITTAGTSEDIGTSFAAPLVSRSLAQVYHQITPTPSPVLARALLTHHARDPRNRERVPIGEEDYLGFGRPQPPPYCLSCERHQATLVFDDTLRPGWYQEWDDFPYPPSLFRDGKFFGQVWMTIAFAPVRGARWGTEYCETHIEANFGVYYEHRSRPKDGSAPKDSLKFRGLVPPEHASGDRLFEDVQVRELRKWAPVRTYFGDMGNGQRGIRWRLKLSLLTRHGVKDLETNMAQPFALIVTIAEDVSGILCVRREVTRCVS